ncbi:MAG: GntR family transcriptional regulator [Acidobacteria bacterium]|nr:GntR family transcriptional regulator [Acidobacteriota bacterium]MCA1652192.1 GntR family transcriptional regulator [Acidobacteriota bacterium]
MSGSSIANIDSGTGRLTDLAYERIKRDIVQCALQPGGEVTEAELASRYNLGKAPVRAALLRLGQDGLVQPLARRGYLITPLTIQDVHDLFEFRLLLEPATAKLAAGRLDKPGVQRLRDLNQTDTVLGTAFNRSNSEFHVAIAAAAGNRRIVEVLSRLHDQMERLFHLQLRDPDQKRGHEEHERIVTALAAGDAEAAERAAAEHIQKGRQTLMEAIFSSPELMAVHINDRQAVRRCRD